MALITTLEGDLDESLLIRSEGVFEDDHERTAWVEYRRIGAAEGTHIHRSVHVHLKRPTAFAQALCGGFGEPPPTAQLALNATYLHQPGADH